MNKVIVFGISLQNTLGLIRSVGEKGIPVILLLELNQYAPNYVLYSKYVTQVHKVKNGDEAIDVLLEQYLGEKEKSILLCGSDTAIAVLDANYDKLKDNFCIFNIHNQQGKINHFLNKLSTFEYAQKSGLNVIKTWHVTDIHLLPDDIVYPCLVKGNNSTGSTKGDLRICYTEEELLNGLREGVDYLVQEYIEKDYELNVNGFSYNHGKNVYIPAVIRKLRDSLYRQGEFLRLDNVDEYPNLNVDALKTFVGLIGYEGLFSIELLCRDNKFYFLEINLRNDGLGYLYTCAGVNYPYLWIKYNTGELTDGYINSIVCKTPYYCMLEKDFNNVIERKISLGKWCSDFFKSDCFYILSKSDPMPFMYSTYVHIRQAIKKVLRKLFKMKIQ